MAGLGAKLNDIALILWCYPLGGEQEKVNINGMVFFHPLPHKLVGRNSNLQVRV